MKSKKPVQGKLLPSFQQGPAANGLSSAFVSVLGGDAAKRAAQSSLAKDAKGPRSHADQINKAPKPAGGANRTMAPGKGHR